MTPTIYIVTPSFNAAETIDRTVLSVLSQAGDFRLRYHVQDGGSTDDTLARLAWCLRMWFSSGDGHSVLGSQELTL